MSAKLPAEVSQPLNYQGLRLKAQGKVRDTYEMVDGHYSNTLMPLATDRISIFDFVLKALIPGKGEILNAMNIFWRLKVMDGIFSNDLLRYGHHIRTFLSVDAVDKPHLQKRAVFVRKLDMLPIEMIVRGYLTGSGWSSYQKDRTVCGHVLASGLQDGSKLSYPLFTPTSKAEEGHDEHLNTDEVVAKFGFVPTERRSLQLYQLAADFCDSRGIVLADTKLEGSGGAIGDEVLTPDSSRFWDKKAWLAAQKNGKVPQAFDKEFVRAWGKAQGIHERNPLNPDDVAWVHSLILPEYVIEETIRRYRYIFWRLTGKKLEEFQRNEMALVEVQPKKLKVDVIVGSDSDIGQISTGHLGLQRDSRVAEVQVHVISCHRNPEALRYYASSAFGKVDVIIAGAGKAAQLPGVLKGWLDHYNNSHIPVLGVAFESNSEKANEAARLSIEELPGTPVRLNSNDQAYFGKAGFEQACEDAVSNEFLPVKNSAKPYQLNVHLPHYDDRHS